MTNICRYTMETKKEIFDFHNIKTFEDACERLGIDVRPLAYPFGGDEEAFFQAWALYKLLIIQKAINNAFGVIRMAGVIILTGIFTLRRKWSH